ncbi:MAG: hypothetical protein Q8S26_15985 [Azonexus sp.]|nr:hypothetical protein [Azonexus sp.]
MPSKNEQFRVINTHFPDMVERIITLWGSAELSEFINGLLLDERDHAGRKLEQEITSALSGLQAEHDREFPKHALQAGTCSEKCLDNEHFKTINARFPRIGRQLQAKWGRPAFSEYVHDLLNDSRTGRQGFPEEAMLALFKLMEVHDKEYPQYVKKITDIWTLGNPT